MSRLNLSQNFQGQSANSTVMFKKNEDDGTKSIIKSFLLENGIDPDKDKLIQAEALLHESNRLHIIEIEGSQRKLIINYIDPAWKYMLPGAQALKKHYKDNVKMLEPWGITITVGGKISYPTDLGERVELVNKFWGYHAGLPVGTSPLDAFIEVNKIDAPNLLLNAGRALIQWHELELSITHEKQEEGERDRIWEPVWDHTKSVGAYLMKLFVANPMMVCDWGYNVVETGGKQSVRVTKIRPDEKKVGTGIVISSTLSNLGEGDIHLYKGKTTKGNPIILKAGEHYVVLKGYSNITVVNPSKEIGAKFSVTVHR